MFDNWLNKSKNKKAERRKPFRNSKRVDTTCRNHGGCPWCESGRLHFSKKKEVWAKDDMKGEIDGID